MLKFREPINTLTHLIGTIASVVGLILLIWATHDQIPKLITMLIYGISMIVLYLASTLFHGIKTSGNSLMRLNRLDHVAIFLLIAGTYTPIAYNLFPNPWRWGILAFVWSVTIVGGTYKLVSKKIHGGVNASIYLILSWGTAVPLIFAINLSTSALTLLFGGGLIYTIGFLIYYFRKPNLWPGIFAHHELWHLFVMGGSLSHFMFIWFYVVPT